MAHKMKTETDAQFPKQKQIINTYFHTVVQRASAGPAGHEGVLVTSDGRGEGLSRI